MTDPFGPLMPKIRAPGRHRRMLRRWFRENIVGRVSYISTAAAQGRGTRTDARRKHERPRW